MQKYNQNQKQELVLVRGIAGTGKSTLCRENYINHLWYEPDSLMKDCRGNYRYDSRTFPEAVKWCKTLADTALSDGYSVIVSDVFLRLEDITPYFELTRHHNCNFKIIECTDYCGSTHNPPLWQIKRMKTAWQAIPLDYQLSEFLIAAPIN